MRLDSRSAERSLISHPAIADHGKREGERYVSHRHTETQRTRRVMHVHVCMFPTTSKWADYVAVQISCGNLSGNELTRNLSGNTVGQSRLSSLSHYGPIPVELVYASYSPLQKKKRGRRKKKKRRLGMNGRTVPQNPRKRG